MQSRSDKYIKGIDVSHHNGNIDWDKVKASGKVDVVYMKATQGTAFISSKFIENYNACKERSIPVGFYHYFDLDKDPGAQAEHFYNIVKDLKHQLLHVLDYEEKGKTAAENTTLALAFRNRLKELTGEEVILYTGGYFARDLFSDGAQVMPLWIAHYGVNTPLDQPKWSEWTGFQYTSSGTIEGINGNVDVNEFTEGIYVSKVASAQPTVENIKPNFEFSESTLVIQKLLNRLDFKGVKGNRLAEDGIKGENTIHAIKSFQEVMGIAVDGIPGPITMSCMDQILEKPTLAVDRNKHFTSAIRYLQWRVGAKVDGIFGWDTNRHVAIFQGQFSLKQDGIAGPITWSKLIG